MYHSATTPESTWLAAFLVSVLLMQVQRPSVSARNSDCLALGVTCGLLVMTNTVFLVSVFVICCLLGLTTFASRISLARFAAIVVLGIGLSVGPWVMRNYLAFDAPMIKGGVWHALLKARHESGYPLWVSSSEILQVEVAGRRLNELQEDILLRQLVIPAVMTHKLEFFKTMGVNFVNLWWEPNRYRDDHSLNYRLGRKLPYFVLLVVSVVPLLLNVARFLKTPFSYFRTNTVRACALIIILSDTLTFSILGAWNIRYHLASEMLMLPFCADGCVFIYGVVHRTLFVSRQASAVVG